MLVDAYASLLACAYLCVSVQAGRKVVDARHSWIKSGARLLPECLEDCGGICGYADLLEAISDPKHLSHEETIEWIGEESDPEHFDLRKVNAWLAQQTRER